MEAADGRTDRLRSSAIFLNKRRHGSTVSGADENNLSLNAR
jgi:hypothetical protein